jgi:hypothetical protein
MWNILEKKKIDTIVDIKNNSTFGFQNMSPQHHSHSYGASGEKIKVPLYNIII